MAVCIDCRSIVENEARFCPHCGVRMPHERLPSRIGPGSEMSLDDWGKVLLDDRIGEGGMGVVYKAWLYYNPEGPKAGPQPHPVAVKVLHPLLQGKPRARRLFLGEAQALERLRHPNIVRLFGLIQEPQLALVIEFVQGEPLSDRIAQAKQNAGAGGVPCLPLAPAWHYFSQLIGALAAIHALGIVHRDIKPANLLLRSDKIMKVTDFGIARLPADQVRDTGGMAPGTGAYMSPEQVSGKELDARADLYSAAIVLYEMLAGTTPFEGEGRNEIMVRSAQIEQAPDPITKRVPLAPLVLDVFFARALAKDPVHRYGSALELGHALQQALGLEESPGWQAQQKFAKRAHAISQQQLAHSASASVAPTDPMAEAEAEKLRTGVMAAYAQPPTQDTSNLG